MDELELSSEEPITLHATSPSLARINCNLASPYICMNRGRYARQGKLCCCQTFNETIIFSLFISCLERWIKPNVAYLVLLSDSNPTADKMMCANFQIFQCPLVCVVSDT